MKIQIWANFSDRVKLQLLDCGRSGDQLQSESQVKFYFRIYNTHKKEKPKVCKETRVHIYDWCVAYQSVKPLQKKKAKEKVKEKSKRKDKKQKDKT